MKIAGKGKKQNAGKKTDVISGTESTGDKSEKTKPQVTHELSMVRLVKFFFYIYVTQNSKKIAAPLVLAITCKNYIF